LREANLAFAARRGVCGHQFRDCVQLVLIEIAKNGVRGRLR
jgi:hypothetical protein